MERQTDGRTLAPGEEADAGSPSSGSAVAAPHLPSHFTFSTDGIPAEGRFETWRDLWRSPLFEIEVSTDRPDSFEGDMELWSAGPLSVAQGEVTRALYERTASFARNGNNDFAFALSQGVQGHISSTKAGTVQVQRDGAFLMPNDRTYLVAPANDHFPFCLLVLNRDALLELMPRNFERDMQTFAPGSKVLDLIRGMVPLITSKTEPMTAAARATLGRQVTDLIALLLDPSRDGRARVEARGLKAARMGAVLKMIEQYFADHCLSADAVGRMLGISARQVHRLLEETTKTFYEHLIERRLLRANELLTGANGDGIKIAEIAFQAGFSDITHFNHAFRARFGDTPTGVRNGAATEPTLRHLRQSIGGNGKSKAR